MLFAALLAGAALQAAVPPAPPLPPAPPAPPSFAAAPPPPPPPLPPLPPEHLHGHDGSQVMSFSDNGRHVTIIKRRPGEPAEAHAMTSGKDDHVLRYKDGEGRDVTVVTDRPLTQADAERMEREMHARLPDMIREGRERGRAEAEVYRKRALEYGADARRRGEEARREGDMARKEGDKAREYAEVVVRKMRDRDGAWNFDGGPTVGVFRHGDFAGPEDLRALRDEVRALRDEVRALKEQLRSGPSR